MNTKELRIGNYFQWKSTGKIDVVSHLEVSYVNRVCVDDVKPIPLTEKWMKDFGFEKDEDDNYVINIGRKSFIVAKAQDDDLILLYREDVGLPYNVLVFIEYVHQLQNLYFDLTGEELKK